MRRQVEDANLLQEARAGRRARTSRTPQQLLLDAAAFQGGTLTVTQASQVTGYTFEEAEGLLREMVSSGYVDVGNEPDSGVVVYYFPELKGRRRLGPDPI